MKFSKKVVSLKMVGLLIAGLALLAIPATAQQEVSPDRPDNIPTDSQRPKPAAQARKAPAAKRKDIASNRNSSGTKSKPAAPTSGQLKADASGSGTNPR